jgi:hypothetical protein
VQWGGCIGAPGPGVHRKVMTGGSMCPPQSNTDRSESCRVRVRDRVGDRVRVRVRVRGRVRVGVRVAGLQG